MESKSSGSVTTVEKRAQSCEEDVIKAKQRERGSRKSSAMTKCPLALEVKFPFLVRSNKARKFKTYAKQNPIVEVRTCVNDILRVPLQQGGRKCQPYGSVPVVHHR